MNARGRVVDAAVVQIILALVDAIRQIAQRLAHLDFGEIVQPRLRRREDPAVPCSRQSSTMRFSPAFVAAIWARRSPSQESGSRTLALSSCTIGVLTPAAVAIRTGGMRIASWKVSMAFAK